MAGWLQMLFNGLSEGSVLLLIALGLAFVFGLMNVINMAHGEFIMVGAYCMYALDSFTTTTDGDGVFGTALKFGGKDARIENIWVFLLGLLLAFLVACLLGIVLEWLLIRFLYGRPLDTLLATVGVSMVLQQVAQAIFGDQNRSYSRPEEISGRFKFELDSGNLVLPHSRLFIMAVVLFCVVAIYIYLQKTSSGRRLRAVMQNREMANCLGVPSRRVDSITFGIGAGLAGVAGACIGLIGSVGPAIGSTYIVNAFLVVVLGGVGNLRGTILAALLIGCSNTLLTKWLIGLESPSATTIARVLVLLIIIAFLQWKPKGLVTLSTR